MRIAIHKPEFTGSFAFKWIEYCKKENLDYLVIDCLDTDIIRILKGNDITHLLWHFSQVWKDLLTARNILFAAELIGIKVFPDFKTAWHFDDKIAQKYLLEAYEIDLAKTFVFYDKRLAENWFLKTGKLPVVAKLRRGSGSTSVILINTRSQFLRYLNKMFGGGLSPTSGVVHDFQRRTKALKTAKDYQTVIRKLAERFYYTIFGIKKYPQELGYIYFQEFIDGNDFDIRIVLVGSKAYGIKRMVRKNDFRASGSGNIIYDISQIDINCVKMGFEISRKLKTQIIAIDFVINKNNKPLVIEISYGFTPRAYDNCEGYWDNNLVFHKGSNILEFDIIKALLGR